MKNKMSRQERREARLRQEKLRLQKKSKLTLIVYAVIRLIVVGVLVRSAFNGQIESVYTCLLTLVLLLLPSILERKLGVRLPAGLEITVVVFIFAAEILGEIACFYVTVPFWDKALHTTSGFIYAVGYSMADVLNRHKKVSFELSPLFLALVAFCFSMTIGALWEILEFSRITCSQGYAEGHSHPADHLRGARPDEPQHSHHDLEHSGCRCERREPRPRRLSGHRPV